MPWMTETRAPVIEVHDLSFGYGPGEPVVKGVGFQVGAGEVLGVLGPSGSGKSTTQKVLTGLLRPFEGTVRVLGRDLRDCGPDYYERIGVGFELPNHYVKLSAIENLRFFASFYQSPADPMELLARVGLEDDAHKRVEGFSKGMKMRLNFVRSLLNDPDVLFLDEPTSGLDPANARLIKDMITEQRDRGKCILLTTHNMHDADELCDNVAFLLDGRIQRIGAPAALRSSQGTGSVVVRYQDGQEQGSETFPLEGLGDNAGFLALLRRVTVLSLRSEETSLEDVFLATTGRRLS